MAWWTVGAGWGLGLTATEVEGSHVPGSVWQAVLVVFWGGRLRAWRRGCGRGFGRCHVVWPPPSWWLALGGGGLGICWLWGPGLGLRLPLLSRLLWFLGLCGVVWVVLLMMLVVVLVPVLLRAVMLFGFRFRFGVGFSAGVRFEDEEDLVPEVWRHWCWVGGRARCATRVPGLPVWGSGGLRKLGVRLQLSPWPLPCG